jgi:hypothetical protein
MSLVLLASKLLDSKSSRSEFQRGSFTPLLSVLKFVASFSGIAILVFPSVFTIIICAILILIPTIFIFTIYVILLKTQLDKIFSEGYNLELLRIRNQANLIEQNKTHSHIDKRNMNDLDLNCPFANDKNN